MLIVSLLPLFLFIALVFWQKIKLLWTSSVSLLITLLLVIFVWEIKPQLIYASFLKGGLIAIDIFLIIFGALFFLDTLNKRKNIENLCYYLKKISADYRIQVILLAWFFESFLEGSAGFGTPAIIVAPLLIGIGLSPIKAVAVALLGNSAAVVFGAAGTPIRVGFAGLNITQVPLYASIINLVSFLVPVFMLWLITSRGKRKDFFEALNFAVFSGLAFVVPSVFFVYLGQEFPSILGSIFGFLIVLVAIKFKLFIPKNIIKIKEDKKLLNRIPLKMVIAPYLFLISLLLFGKFLIGGLSMNFNFGISHTMALFNPGLIFILAAIPTIFLFNKNNKFELKNIMAPLKQSFEPFLVIVLISTMVQLMIQSGNNSSGYQSLLAIVASSFENKWLAWLTPLIGAFGSFLTGSATVSNLMFGSILQNSSQLLGLNTAIILSMQMVGAAAGNMIALADVLPALAVVGLKNKEVEVIKKVLIPCLIYTILAAFAGVCLLRVTG